MRTENWFPVYKQDHLEDGTWVNYMVGVYDSRDTMSDCLKPSWTRSGEYSIQVIKAGNHYSCDYCFEVITNDKSWGNRIAANIKRGKFSCLNELLQALRKLAYLGELTQSNGAEHLYIYAQEK